MFKCLPIQIAAVWIISFLIFVPSLSGIRGQHGLECDSRNCAILDDENGQNPTEILKGLGLILPVVILVVADVSIFWKMRVSSSF